MVYRQYTNKKVVRLPLIFKCEVCGKYSLFMHPFIIQSTYNDKVYLGGKSVSEREADAHYQLASKERSLHYKLTDEVKRRKMRDSGFACSCSHCKTTPKWSKFRNIVLDFISNAFIVASLFIGAFMLLGIIEDRTPFSSLLIPVAILVIGTVPRHVIYKIKEYRVNKMDEEYMPILCETMDDLNETVKKLGISNKTQETKNQ